jgi:hypothetical protein
MSEAEQPHKSLRKKIFGLKHGTYSLSAVLIIIAYLGFVSMSLVPMSTDNFKEFSGRPIAANAEAESLDLQPTQISQPTQAPPSPTATASPTPTRTIPAPTLTPRSTTTPLPSLAAEETQALALPAATEIPLLGFGDWSCRYCDKMPVKVKMTHYWPPLGGENCWWFYEGYCHSPMKSSVPWETLVEIAAACPAHWLGGVVEVPDIGRRFLCLDTGDKVLCEDNVCVVDVLTQTRYEWDGLVFDAIVYYPRVWTDGTRPDVTPFADEGDN